ncbi:MAG: hypothetical protein OS112_00480 [Methanoregula sp.]|nr:MAG: hypothetical protein OS112_00480 [Methanoregula sp.]
MTEDFCNRTARRIRKIGYAPKVAARIARFCHVSMLSVCGLMGAMLDPSMKSMAGEEGERPLRLPMMVPSVEILLNRGHGNISLGVRAPLQLLIFTIQRRPPAL